MFSYTKQWCLRKNWGKWKMLMIFLHSLDLLHKVGSQNTCTAATRFTCKDGTCISIAKVCNRRRDCRGGEDELDCDGRAKCRPRDGGMARLNGYDCSIACHDHAECGGRGRRCRCDDECGRSCLNRRTRCGSDPPDVNNTVKTYVMKVTTRLRIKLSRKPYYYGYVANYLCKRGLTLRGPLPRCNGFGQWSAEKPECVDTRCHDEPPTVLHSVNRHATRTTGARRPIVTSPPYHFGDILTYVCEPGRTLQGHSPSCGEGGKWSQDVPKCLDFNECGQAGEVQHVGRPDRIVGGQHAVKTSWPWFALITQKSTTPEKSLEKKRLLGGGSVIHKYWVLTAAHVVIGKEKSENVIFVGLSERPSEQEFVEPTAKYYSIAEYVVHPNFHKYGYNNNDIALIKLGSGLNEQMDRIHDVFNGLNFGSAIRAICISGCSTESSSVKPCDTDDELIHGQAVVIGFGHVDVSFTTDLGDDFNPPLKLKQVELRIENRTRCHNAARDIRNLTKISNIDFTENMMCFGPSGGNTNEDSCNGDSGGPLMKQVRGPDNGTSRWVQIGIVSFGYGCGNDYPGFYTDVSEYTSWIDRIINGEPVKTCTVPTVNGGTSDCEAGSTVNAGEMCNITCDEGYYLTSEISFNCTGQDTWNGIWDVCSIETCTVPTVNGGTSDCEAGSTVNFGQMCSVKCNEGYYITSEIPLKCTGRGRDNWSETWDVCSKITCSRFPTLDDDGFLSYCSDNKYGAHCPFTCGENARRLEFATCEDKDKSIDRNSDGYWDISRSACPRDPCGPPELILSVEHGHLVDFESKTFEYMERITVECDDWYEYVAGCLTWRCGKHSQWVRDCSLLAPNPPYDLPICRPKCGMRLVPNDAFLSDHGGWPWMVFVDTGGGREGKNYCGGVLVDDKTVVTAATCVYVLDVDDDVHVWLGILDRINDNHTFTQHFVVPESRRFVEHTFRMNPFSFDGDIAVLKLDRAADLSYFVHPICLPRPRMHRALVDRYVEERRTAILTGWGKTRHKKYSRDLIKTRLPFVDWQICQQRYEKLSPDDNQLTENMLCAGFKYVANNPCTGDTGSPLMAKDGRDIWYIIGITSFGTSCGRSRAYRVFTDVSKFEEFLRTLME